MRVFWEVRCTEHGIGRCFRPASSPVDRSRLVSKSTHIFFYLRTLSSIFTTSLHTHSVYAWRSCGNVIALFSLFENAMLSASQNDITHSAPHWWVRVNRPYLKEQCSASWVSIINATWLTSYRLYILEIYFNLFVNQWVARFFCQFCILFCLPNKFLVFQ